MKEYFAYQPFRGKAEGIIAQSADTLGYDPFEVELRNSPRGSSKVLFLIPHPRSFAFWVWIIDLMY